MDGIPLKRIKTDVKVYPELCVICQLKTKQNTTTSEIGRRQVTKAAGIRNDIVLERIKLLDSAIFVYHSSNKCFKTYTMEKTLTSISTTNKSDQEVVDDEKIVESVSNKQRTTRSVCTPRAAPCGAEVDVYNTTCIVCSFKKHGGTYTKYRISETDRATKFLKAAVCFQDAVYTRICDLEDSEAVFGADVFYHASCMRSYLKKYEKNTEGGQLEEAALSLKMTTFLKLIEDIEQDLDKGRGYTLSDLRDKCNEKLDSKSIPFNNKEIKLLITQHYGDDICISTPSEANKPSLVYLTKNSKADMVDLIQSIDPIKDCATEIRRHFLNEDFSLEDRFCEANDLQEAWERIKFPEPVMKFMSTLFNFNPDQFYEKGEDEDLEGDELECRNPKVSDSKRRKVIALYQIIYFIIHNGRKKTPLHILNAEAIHQTCRSKTLITSFNHFGLSTSYDDLLRYHNDIASFVVESSETHVPLPSHFNPELHTMGAFDNFDHEEDTESGVGGSHDTVSILMQDKSINIVRKPLISETSVAHGPRQFKEELPCQVLKEFIKPAKRADLNEEFVVTNKLFSIDPAEYNAIEAKDMAWSLARLDLSNIQEGVVQPISDVQNMPSWSAFNSVVSDETLPQKAVGFLPVLPYPVTEYTTVYTALINFQDILSQLKQMNMAVFCDEGVYKIAREILLYNPTSFKNIVLCLGSFHMAKVVMASIGKYLDGSGAKKIWTNKQAFGVNVALSIIAATHYKRTLKGLCLLSECLERLQWCEFFSDHSVGKYVDLMCLLQGLKEAIAAKDREKSKETLQLFTESSQILKDDFAEYKVKKSSESETFHYWDNFIQMVKILRDLIRADREGNWNLHLHSLKAILPFFAVFDRTNYLRWCSLYVEDMQKLSERAPDVYTNFQEGKFSVKHTPGKFKAVAADMCLEQTINRSQKSTAGIIGNTRKKQFVAQWEIIYHEMLAVSNLHKYLSGLNLTHDEFSFNHEFNSAYTNTTERKIEDMIHYVQSHENPIHISSSTNPKLHHILTQEILTEDISLNLLNVRQKGEELYEQFRKERYIEKSKRLSHPITRTNLKTFKDLEVRRKPEEKKKQQRIDSIQAQKFVDLARVRGYDLRRLFQFDLTASSYLFDENNLMTDSHKSTLCTELEKNLTPNEYVQPWLWSECKTAYLVDVMQCIRRMKLKKSVTTFGDFVKVCF